MKRFVTSLVAVGILVTPTAALANPANWTVQLSSPYSATGGKANSRTFGISSSVSSINASEVLSVSLYQDGSLLNSFSENSSSYGGSWSQTVTVPADGSYVFKAVASNSNGDADKVIQTVVSVDATAPSSPAYLGKTNTGTSYTVKFTAPSNSDVTEVRVYANTSTSFTTNTASQVAILNVTPGQTGSVVYNAPDNSPRYFAVRAYDAHGNGSSAVGDPVVTGSSASSTTSGGSSTTTGTNNSSVGRTSTTPPGVVESNQNESQDSNKQNTSNVASANQKNKTDWTTVAVTLALLGVLYAGYQWFMQNADKE